MLARARLRVKRTTFSRPLPNVRAQPYEELNGWFNKVMILRQSSLRANSCGVMIKVPGDKINWVSQQRLMFRLDAQGGKQCISC